ncbi:uncharacterized protein KY384_004981 [Bacidia gigantensis]|uniref:uncharacterized protein n=1 Tax=Bacidia gigantensis TaxID=2732470 RepID=UPI001D04E388|nr:uncharacterized protein KY384_004981 [Bacidia gigantensis]KAG8530478.1 hypothetical protein KY384_004981 [Bacidia gigantensis]
MSEQYSDDGDPGGSSRDDYGEIPSDIPLKPNYMTVGNGSTSASAAALISSLEQDSGYGGSIADGYSNDGGRAWHPGITEDRYTPADTPGNNDPTTEKRALASHVHQLYYNQNRATLGRQITQTIETLKDLQRFNAGWPAQYPSVHEPQSARPEPRPGLQHTNSSSTSRNAPHSIDNIPLRPNAPKRAATTLENSSPESSSSAKQKEEKEPERLITPESAREFSVLKLNMNVQGLTQAEIAHSIKKESVAQLLDGKISQSIRHLLLLRDRIEDISSKVLITGDLNAGKSTFCNALLRRKVLPEDQQPCTSIFCEVLDAKENGNIEEAHAVHRDAKYDRNDESSYDVYQLLELEKVVTDLEHYVSCKVYVKDQRTIDESLLNNGVVDISLTDAPGLNSDSVKTTAVYAREEEVDVVVFVVSAANHFTLSAKEFLWNAAREKAYIFIVVNGFDNIRDKARCERMILEQVHGLSPRTFKESSELVHFVSSNAIPVAPASGPPDGGGGGGSGGSGSSSGPSNDFSSPDDDDDEESLGKHGEPGSPPKKGKGKDKEKIRDFEELESSLRRFVLEKRARSKLAPAKTYLANILADVHSLAVVNRDVAHSELERVVNELEEIEPAFEKSKQARSDISDELERTIEDSCAEIYRDTRTVVNNAIAQSAQGDASVVYPGLTGASQYAEELKAAMLEQISSAVSLCEEKARTKTFNGCNTIKSLGLLHLGDQYAELTLNPKKMFSGKKDALSREVDFDVEFADFFDIQGHLSGLWDQNDKLAGTSMALTVAGAFGTRMLGGFGWVDGALGAVRVIGPQNTRRMIIPGVVFCVLLTSAYLLRSIPNTLPRRLSRRITSALAEVDYTHKNADRIAKEVRKVLRVPEQHLLNGLQQNYKELGEKREDKRKVEEESRGARKYFANLIRTTETGRAKVEDVDLDSGGPGIAGSLEA